MYKILIYFLNLDTDIDHLLVELFMKLSALVTLLASCTYEQLRLFYVLILNLDYSALKLDI